MKIELLNLTYVKVKKGRKHIASYMMEPMIFDIKEENLDSCISEHTQQKNRKKMSVFAKKENDLYINVSWNLILELIFPEKYTYKMFFNVLKDTDFDKYFVEKNALSASLPFAANSILPRNRMPKGEYYRKYGELTTSEEFSGLSFDIIMEDTKQDDAKKIQDFIDKNLVLCNNKMWIKTKPYLLTADVSDKRESISEYSMYLSHQQQDDNNDIAYSMCENQNSDTVCISDIYHKSHIKKFMDEISFNKMKKIFSFEFTPEDKPFEYYENSWSKKPLCSVKFFNELYGVNFPDNTPEFYHEINIIKKYTSKFFRDKLRKQCSDFDIKIVHAAFKKAKTSIAAEIEKIEKGIFEPNLELAKNLDEINEKYLGYSVLQNKKTYEDNIPNNCTRGLK